MFKKLVEIESKLDKVLQLLESQEQKVDERNNSNRQFLCELLEKKTEVLLNENKEWIEIIEMIQHDTESKLSDVAGQNMEAFKNLRKTLENYDKVIKKTLKAVQQDVEKEKSAEKELAEKLELVENEIRMLLLNSVMDQLP